MRYHVLFVSSDSTHWLTWRSGDSAVSLGLLESGCRGGIRGDSSSRMLSADLLVVPSKERFDCDCSCKLTFPFDEEATRNGLRLVPRSYVVFTAPSSSCAMPLLHVSTSDKLARVQRRVSYFNGARRRFGEAFERISSMRMALRWMSGFYSTCKAEM